MTMQWTHKDHEINLVGERFRTLIAGKSCAYPSLEACKKAIDKHLDVKATAVELNLPVVVLRSKGLYGRSTGEGEAVFAAITGVDPSDNKVQGVRRDGFRNDYVLPASKENEKIINDFLRAERDAAKAKKAIEARSFGTYIHQVRGKNMPYADAVTLLQQRYEKAKQAKSED